MFSSACRTSPSGFQLKIGCDQKTKDCRTASWKPPFLHRKPGLYEENLAKKNARERETQASQAGAVLVRPESQGTPVLRPLTQRPYLQRVIGQLKMGAGSTLQFTHINSFALQTQRLLLFPEVSFLVESNSTRIRSLSALPPGSSSDPEALNSPPGTESSPQGEHWDEGKDEEGGCLSPPAHTSPSSPALFFLAT